uniref:Uncharacterized protein n=1 Tax=Lotus japonicus TaxID=34305 RepID=I3SIR7_LOTJA|nr:unknown [Lotus japonicus]
MKELFIETQCCMTALSSNLSFTHFEIISNNKYHLEIIENVSELFNLKWVFEFGVTTVLLLLVLATTVTVIVEK